MSKEFIEWLEAKKDEASPTGDLVCDMHAASFGDEKMPTNYDELEAQMMRMGACSEALGALEDAYKEWKNE